MELYLIANCFVLFFGGFDTSSTIMSICCHFLAKYPNIQDKLFEEIDKTIEDNDGKQNLDYNTVQGMQYLDMVLHETLRMYPLTVVERLCVKDYKVPGYKK